MMYKSFSTELQEDRYWVSHAIIHSTSNFQTPVVLSEDI